MPRAKGKMQEVRIEPVLNGWIVRVGCAAVVAIDKDLMLGEISRYIDNPRLVLAENLRAEVNEGTYTPDEMVREALGQPPGAQPEERSSARQVIPADVAPPDNAEVPGPNPETPPTEGQGIHG